jgi:hypothetical protein
VPLGRSGSAWPAIASASKWQVKIHDQFGISLAILLNILLSKLLAQLNLSRPVEQCHHESNLPAVSAIVSKKVRRLAQRSTAQLCLEFTLKIIRW